MSNRKRIFELEILIREMALRIKFASERFDIYFDINSKIDDLQTEINIFNRFTEEYYKLKK
jgi:hypothetical protein